MKLWTIKECKIGTVKTVFWDVLEEGNDTPVPKAFTQELVQLICDEHNAWAIAAERKWSVAYSNYYQAWVVYDDHGKAVHWPMITNDNSPGKYDTPIAAILAADSWLREREQ